MSQLPISIIVPLYDEEENIGELFAELEGALKQLGLPAEIILVNDGSRDRTGALLADLAEANSHVKVINFRRNYGQTAALMAGFEFARGNILIPMDGDLQNDPRDIIRLLEKIDEGYDVVSGWRKQRHDRRIVRLLPSRVANKLISVVGGVRLHDYGCTLKAYRKEALEGVKLYGEMHRFIPIYASLEGARVTEIVVNHRPRRHGESKYGLERITKVLLDLLVVKFLSHYANKPIYLFGGFGLTNMLIGFMAGGYAVYLKLFEETSFILTPLPLLTVMAFITGCMSILMGFLAEVAVRTHYESQGKPVYSIKSRINFDSD